MKELSKGETEVLSLAADGFSVEETAKKLCWSVATIKHRRRRAMEKLGAVDTTHAVAIALRKGIIR